jgi:hypothetical protein
MNHPSKVCIGRRKPNPESAYVRVQHDGTQAAKPSPQEMQKLLKDTPVDLQTVSTGQL